jgi:hypothetical protein
MRFIGSWHRRNSMGTGDRAEKIEEQQSLGGELLVGAKSDLITG